MKKLLAGADEYLNRSTWRDIAVLKFCLLSLGLMIGMEVPEEKKERIRSAAAFLFVVTYIPLMVRYLRILVPMLKQNKD